MADYGKAYRQSMERVWLAVEHLSTEYGESMADYGKLIDRVWREYG